MVLRKRPGAERMETNENQAGIAEPVTEDTAQHTESSDDAINADQLTEMFSDPVETPTQEETPEEEVLTEQTADLEQLTEAQLEQLAEQMNSRGAERIAQLIRERKELESKIEQLSTKENPLEEAPSAEANPFAEIDSTEGLREKYTEVNGLIEHFEEILEDYDDEHRDTVVYQEDGQDYTKAQVRKMVRAARRAKEQHLPARYEQLQAKEQVIATRAQYETAAGEQFSWMKEAENPIKQRYEQVLNNPALKQLRDQMPEIPLVIAHAADSIARSEAQKQKGQPATTARAPQQQTKQPLRLKPPASPNGSNAAPAKQVSKPAKELQALQSQFEKTGDYRILTEIFKQNA